LPGRARLDMKVSFRRLDHFRISRARLLSGTAIALIPSLALEYLALAFAAPRGRLLPCFVFEAVAAGIVAWYLFQRSRNLEAWFFTVRTQPDLEEENERALYDVLGYCTAAFLLGLPIWLFLLR
jgi:hypothetical protein